MLPFVLEVLVTGSEDRERMLKPYLTGISAIYGLEQAILVEG